MRHQGQQVNAAATWASSRPAVRVKSRWGSQASATHTASHGDRAWRVIIPTGVKSDTQIKITIGKLGKSESRCLHISFVTMPASRPASEFAAAEAASLTPYTSHSLPHTPSFTLYTLHSIPHTLLCCIGRCAYNRKGNAARVDEREKQFPTAAPGYPSVHYCDREVRPILKHPPHLPHTMITTHHTFHTL